MNRVTFRDIAEVMRQLRSFTIMNSLRWQLSDVRRCGSRDKPEILGLGKQMNKKFLQ
jgi:hypothetical protein